MFSPRCAPSRVAAFVLYGALVSCVREKQPSAANAVPTVTAAPVGSTSAPSSEPPPKGDRPDLAAEPCDTDDLPPPDMISDNIAATELSAIGEVVSATSEGLDGKRPAPTTGYINFEYEVRVLRQFAGPKHERLTLNQGVEAGAKLRPVGSLLFFSACASKKGDGTFYEPDVGYLFHFDGSCRAEVESRAAAAKGGGQPTACQP